MALPIGVQKVTVHIGNSFAVAGTEATITGTISPIFGGTVKRAIWQATGGALSSVVEKFESIDGGEAFVQVPDPHQAGWVVPETGADGQTLYRAISDWGYRVDAVARFPGGGGETITKTFKVAPGQTSVDLDLVADGQVVSGVQGPYVPAGGTYPVQQVELTEDIPDYTLPLDAPLDQVITVVFTQGGAGGHTVTFGGQPVTVDLTAGAVTAVEFVPTGAGYVVRYPVTTDALAALAATEARPVGSWQFVPPALHRLDAALAKATSAASVVVGLGDSLFESLSSSTYALSIPGRASGALQALAGVSGSTVAFIPAAWPTEGEPLAPQDMIPTTTGTVTKSTGASGALGPARKSILLAPAATLTFQPVICTGYDIIYSAAVSSNQSFTYDHGEGAVSVSASTTRTTLTALASAGDTTLNVAAVPSDWYPGAQLILNPAGPVEYAHILSIAGLSVTLKSGLASTWAAGTSVGAHGNGGYVKQVRGLVTAARSVVLTAVTNATIEGIRYFNGDEAAGIQWINAGHAGIRADQLKRTGNTDRSFDYIGQLAPAAIFCDLMINDSGVKTPSQMVTNLTTLRSDVNAAVVARGGQIPSWVQVIPYEVDPINTRYQGASWASYVDALYAWAKADTSGPGGESGIHIVDLGRRMPRSDLSASFYVADRIHPTDAGAAEFVHWLFRGLPVA